MKKQIVIDEFFTRQPSLEFVKDLKKPVHTEAPYRFCRTEAENGEVCVDGLYVNMQFSDSEGLLETVIDDFNRFISLCNIKGEKYPITLKKGETEQFESYIIEVTANGCTITANDTEGIRRGLIFIEDELTAREGAFLPIGTIKRKPWLKNRVTRGFFSPTNRPPKNGDELLDNIDYYPDEYLNRMMHDGTNGLWIYSSFNQLIPSDIITEYGKDYEKRIQKLNKVINKCRLYGVKVFIFAIEPISINEELAKKYSNMVGQKVWNNMWTMCPHSEQVKEYCYEAGYKLFSLCPNLGGFISITAGERPTSCASPQTCTCPRCSALPRGEILAENIKNLFAGMQDAKPDAECISWTYGHRVWKDNDILDYVKNAPDSAILMQNFDDRGFEEQLGVERQAMDYWLSYIGPSQLFQLTANAAKEHSKKLWAKMQICCSHEIASLPYIPSPGNVFGKLKGAYEYGVEGIMESWYFGNYPCFMSKAVGDIAFCHDFSDESAYLTRLASIHYGKSSAENIVKAWKLFKKGYCLYPINIMFSYYSPAHDGVVWELSLKPKNLAPSRSWLLLDKPNGDRICDSLLVGHTHEEALKLFGDMKKYYSLAMEELSKVYAEDNAALKDLYSVASSLLVLCRSTYNILLFYKLRDNLGTGVGNSIDLLNDMRKIVLDEIEESQNMISLCEKDKRLGYHSEAEGYKFFPDKLRHRINQLNELLKTEFPEVETRIKNGLPPLEYYLGIEADCEHSYTIKEGPIEDSYWETMSDGKRGFRIACSQDDFIIELRSPTATNFVLQPEFRLFSVTPGIRITLNSNGKHTVDQASWSEHWPFYKPEKKAAELKKWKIKSLPADENGYLYARISISKTHAGMRGNAPFKLSLESESDIYWETEENKTKTLGKYTISPGCFGWVKFE